jgi:hypothetical protein
MREMPMNRLMGMMGHGPMGAHPMPPKAPAKK